MDVVDFVVEDCWRRMRFSERDCFEFFIIRKEETVFFVFVGDKVGGVALEKGSEVNNMWWRSMSVSCALFMKMLGLM